MIHGIIFDLDGTLLNTLEDLCDSTNFALNKFGYPSRTVDEVRQFVGNGVRLLIERALPQGVGNPDYEKCLETFKEHYRGNMYNKTAPYDGILSVLKDIKLKGIQTAIVSNKFDDAVKGLSKKYFGDLINVSIGENEKAGIRKKPAPDSVFKAIAEIKVSIEHVVYVGDSETDVQTAKNAEIECIGCTWGFQSAEIVQAGADYIVNSPNELLQVVEKL